MQPPLAVLLRYPPHGSTLGGLLASRARADAARTLLWFEGRETSYAEFARRVHAAALDFQNTASILLSITSKY